MCIMQINLFIFTQTDILSIYKGALAEQFIWQELAAAQNHEVYYWSREAKISAAEVDYLVAINNRICPVKKMSMTIFPMIGSSVNMIIVLPY